jgi:chemotaxis-related protein WspB
MLLLMFRAGGQPYAVDAGRVVEVVPRVEPRPLPRAPDFLCGVLPYRGGTVPVVDFGVLAGAGPSRNVLSTRVVIANVRGRDAAGALIGLLAEDVTRVVEGAADTPSSDMMEIAGAPFLGPLVRVGGELVQLVEIDRLPPAWPRAEAGGGASEAG